MFTRERRRRRRRRVAVGAAVAVFAAAVAAVAVELVRGDDREPVLAADEPRRLAGDGSDLDPDDADDGPFDPADPGDADEPGDATDDDPPDDDPADGVGEPTADPTDERDADAGEPAPAGQWLPAGAAVPRTDAPSTGLTGRLRAVLADPALQPASGRLRVTVLDADGRTVLDVAGDEPGLPASTLKVVTAAAALQAFGPDHRFTTTVDAPRAIEGGVLRGDLVITGVGDPVLASPLYGRNVYPQRPRTPIEDLADALVRRGLRRIEGRVVGDPRVLGEERLPEGWKDEYLHDLNGRQVRGLTVDAGIAIIPPRDETSPEALVAAELGRPFLVDDTGLDDRPRLLADQVDDPARQAAEVLKALLEDRGVEVTGGTTVLGPAGIRVPTPTPVRLAHVRSPRLADLVEHMLEQSDNHLADSLLRLAGTRAVGELPAGDGSFDAGEAAALAALRWLGLGHALDDARGLRIADGSGLSRDDRLTTRVLAHLEHAMTSSPAAEPVWTEAMAEAGVEGTVRRRLRGTPAHGRFVAKSGTLDDVRAMVGTVHGADGARHHLAVIGDDLVGAFAVSALADRLAIVLAEDLGCGPPPPDQVGPDAPGCS